MNSLGGAVALTVVLDAESGRGDFAFFSRMTFLKICLTFSMKLYELHFAVVDAVCVNISLLTSFPLVVEYERKFVDDLALTIG